MRNYKESIDNLRGLFGAVLSALSGGLFALIVLTQLAQQRFVAPAADLGYVNSSVNPIAQRAATAPVESGAKVSIVNFAFTPEQITIKPGQTITWINDDGAPHALKFQDGAKGTDLMLPGATFNRPFDEPGTYDYSCSVHPYMTGRVVVSAR
jgi:plastocyanin